MQAATINGYTSTDFHHTFNRYLVERSIDPTLTENPTYEAISRVLGNALESIPTPYPDQVYRGVSLTNDQLSRYRVAAQSGHAIIEPFFISTSADLTKAFPRNTMFFINTKSGRLIEKISQSKLEREVLIPAGKSFNVTDVIDTPGLIEIYMDEI